MSVCALRRPCRLEWCPLAPRFAGLEEELPATSLRDAGASLGVRGIMKHPQPLSSCLDRGVSAFIRSILLKLFIMMYERVK